MGLAQPGTLIRFRGVEGRHAVIHRNPRVTRAPLRARVDTTHGCSRLPPSDVGSPCEPAGTEPPTFRTRKTRGSLLTWDGYVVWDGYAVYHMLKSCEQE